MAQVETRRLSLETLDAKPVQAKDAEMDPMQIVVTQTVVEKIIQAYDPSLTVVDFSAEAGSNIGDNYMAIMYAVAINVKKAGSSNSKTTTLNVMLKTMPLNPARQEMANQTKVFLKEALMYGSVFRDLSNLQRQLGWPENEIYSDYPLCYATFVDGKADYLAMENLKLSGYKMADRTLGLDRAHVSLAMKSVGRFHALSYVKFRGNFQAIQAAYPDLEDTMWSENAPNEMLKMFVGESIKNASAALRAAGYESEAVLLEGPKFDLDSILRLMLRYSKPCKYAIIGHADCWTNNMMFKYDPETGKPVEIKLIDFQLSKPCSRTLDLLYFMNGCLREDLVNNSEKEFLKIYYDEFSTMAQKLGFLEPELTYEQLLAEFEECRPYGVVMSLICLPFFYANKADLRDMEELSPELSQETVKEFFGSMVNSTAARRMSNILKVQLPMVKM